MRSAQHSSIRNLQKEGTEAQQDEQRAEGPEEDQRLVKSEAHLMNLAGQGWQEEHVLEEALRDAEQVEKQ